MNDDWRDYETNQPATQDPDSEWIEVPIRFKMKGSGSVRGFVKRPPGRTVRIICSGERVSPRMDDDIESEIERISLARRASVRNLLLEHGRPDLVEEYDQKMRDCDTGVMGARSTWSALSAAQRRVVITLADAGGHLVRSSQTRYDLMTPSGAVHVPKFCGIPTARNLVARSILECDGGALDPELRLNITERGRFVRKFGCPAV